MVYCILWDGLYRMIIEKGYISTEQKLEPTISSITMRFFFLFIDLFFDRRTEVMEFSKQFVIGREYC